MNLFKKFLMFFVHHFIRPIWILPIGLVYYIIYFFKVNTNLENKIQYNKNKTLYNNIKTLQEFIDWWNNNYRGTYKWDGYKGLLDHNNSNYEFFLNAWDCDDASTYPYYKFKKLGYKSIMIGLLGEKITSWHYDCIVEIDKDKYMLFNQGSCIYAKSIKDCLDMLSSRWDIFKTYIYWKCFW